MIVGGRILAEDGIGVSIYDLRKTFSTRDVDMGALCRSGQINIWARYKPIRLDTIFPITYQQRKNKHFGIRVPFCTSYLLNGKVKALLDDHDSNEGWMYEAPRGDRTNVIEGSQYGIKEFHRITDFVGIPNDNTDPNAENLRGYYHTAPVPLVVLLNTTGMKEMWDSDENVSYYEINTILNGSLDFTFINNVRGDMTLQDFINLSDKVTRNNKVIAWRPFVQIFEDKYVSGRLVKWYDSTTAFKQYAGDEITNDDDASWTVSVPLNNNGFDFDDPTKRYHICVGVACCDKDATEFRGAGSGNEDVFLMPYDKFLFDEGDYQFYYCFHPYTNFERRVHVTALKYGTANASYDGTTTFTIPKNSSGTLSLITIAIELNEQQLYFVGEHGTSPDDSIYSMKIKLVEYLYGQERKSVFLRPANEQGQVLNPERKLIPTKTAAQSDTYTFYALTTEIDVNDIGNGEYMTYYMFVDIGGSGYVRSGMFTIHKLK